MNLQERYQLAEDPSTTAEELWALLGGRPPSLIARVTSSTVDLILVDGGPNKIATIKQLRLLTGLGLKETKAYFEQTPSLIVKGGALEEMLSWSKQLEDVGAKARLRGLLGREDTGLCRRLAKHPNAPKDLLEYLWHSNDPETVEGIAQNPNTPTELLFFVAKEHPAAFFQNPLLPLWQLEDPLLRQLPQEILPKLLLSQETLDRFWPALLDARQHRLLLAASALSLPEGALLALAADSDYEVRSKLAQHPNIPDSLVEKLSRDRDERVRAAVVRHPKLPRALRETLWQDKSPRVKAELAAHPETPEELLYQFAQEDEEDLWGGLAQNPNLPIELFERLALEYECFVQLAQNPKTPDWLLEEISKSYDHLTLLALAERPSLPTEILCRLITSHARNVRRRASCRPDAPKALVSLLRQAGATEDLEKFSQELARDMTEEELSRLLSYGPFAYELLAQHPNTPKEQITKLIAHTTPEIRELARKHPKADPALVDLLTRAESTQEKERPTLTPQELATLSRLSDWGEQLAGKHPNTDEETFIRIANPAAHRLLLRTLLENPKTPTSAISQIAERLFPHLFFRRLLAAHPNTPKELFQRLFEASSGEDSEEKAMPISSALSQNPSTPEEILWKLAKERPWLREEIKQNAGTPKDLLKWIEQEARS